MGRVRGAASSCHGSKNEERLHSERREVGWNSGKDFALDRSVLPSACSHITSISLFIQDQTWGKNVDLCGLNHI